ncbi:class I SAM-dependent RNA methyltransferase [Chelatococcus sambhunathii]|uniref:Class I SAM-dependent RNA methyltransferase n=1 Tax=Chelatococcus sambhunathii TaxID=363953 RepID=A0ABU1DI76_9HYPH|nr:RNA methyltransferase [Chelatococcus sambhunathii]MDR4307794.1 class I SAM-dependent RNA methyltransferase [Chelatococcus sambhunathii]
MTVERLRIERLGARGDGVAAATGGAVFVARALPGELVLADRDGDRAVLLDVVEPSPDRVTPYCPEVGRCGGCATQEFAQDRALNWKRELLIEAFARERLSVADATAPTIDAHGAGRRRATFHARIAPHGRVVTGFSEARSHTVVALSDCPLLAPQMAGALPAARAVAKTLAAKRKPLDLLVTATESGLDLDARGSGPVSEDLRLRLVRLAEDLDLARLSIHGDVVVARRKPLLQVGRARLTPPPGGFLQATAEGEAVLAALALEGIGKAKRVADLFCGSGAFALRIAERAEVFAADSEKPSIAALDAAFRTAQGLKRVTSEARDLFRRPLTPKELERFDAVVFDPPRAGAEAQARALAASKVKTVVAVSCNATTFARDARILVDGGYRPKALTPVDQFRHSAHVEAVGVFGR